MGSSTKKQKTKTAPWKAQQPFIKDTFTQGQNLYNSSATPNADLTGAWNMTRNNLSDPNSGYNKSMGYYKNVMDTGGYDKGVFDNMASPIIANVTSQFMGSGRTGGGLEGIDLTKQLTNAYAPYAAQQMNMAAANLPQLEGQGTNALYNIGQQQYQYPWQNLQNYQNVVAGNNWGSQTTSKVPVPSTLAQIGGYIVGNMGQAAQMMSGAPGGGGGTYAQSPQIY